LKLLIVWKIQIQIQLASTSTPGTSGYMAPEILLKRASTKSDVYSFGVLLIQLVNGSPFILDGNEVHIRKFIQWAQNVHVEENGFQQIFDVVINNSIIGFDRNEAKSFLQISLQCIKVIFVPNLLCVSFNLLSSKFEKPKSWIRCST
jgi:serine/threonine protein kinase